MIPNLFVLQLILKFQHSTNKNHPRMIQRIQLVILGQISRKQYQDHSCMH